MTNPSRAQAAAAVVAVAGLCLNTSSAWGFCRTTTCDSSTQDCSPDENLCVTQGKALNWASNCLGYSIQKDVTPNLSYELTAQVVRRAFDSWQNADCGGQTPALSFFDLGAVACGATEYNQDGGNANIIAFRPVVWPYSNSSNTLALTTVTFNTESGEIYDADIEVNSAQVDISVSETDVTYDLQSILTHEIGHFFGLSHSNQEDATMYARYRRGSLDLRTLSDDDIAAVCTVYPPGREGVCDPTPRHGFQTICGEASGSNGCAAAPGTGDDWRIVLLVAGSVMIAARRRRRFLSW